MGDNEELYAGARAAASHTGSLAGADNAVDSLFTQAGVIRATSIEELFVVATAFASQPLPAGPRVALVTNSGGPAILATDACIQLGLQVPPLSEATQERIRTAVAAEASVTNPVDMIATAAAPQYEAALRAVAADPGIDALIDKIIFADDRATLEAATKALDRVLMAHNFVVPSYTILMSRLARWDRFSHPDPLPEYAVGFPTIWWWDAEKAAKTGGSNTGS